MLKYNPKKTQILLLFVLAILIPSGFYRFEGVFIAALFLNGFVIMKGYKQIYSIPKEYLLLILFFLLYVVGLFYTENTKQQFSSLTQHASFLIIPLSFLGYNISELNRIKIKKYFIWSTVFFIIIAFCFAFYSTLLTGKSTIYVNDSVQSKFSYYGLTRVFKNWHPTYVSLFANLSLVFAYNIYLKKRKFVFATIVFSVCIVGIFFLNSFIGIIAFGMIALLWVLSLFRTLWHRFFLITLFLAITFSFFYYNPLHYSKIDQLKETGLTVTDKKDSRNMLNLRLVKWQASYSLFKSSPVIGVTAGDLKDRMVQYYEANDFHYAAQERFSSHNQYLFVLASFGIVGFVLFLAIILYPLKLGGEIKILLLLFLIFCLTEDILERQQGLVFFVFMYALLLEKHKENNDNSKNYI